MKIQAQRPCEFTDGDGQHRRLRAGELVEDLADRSAAALIASGAAVRVEPIEVPPEPEAGPEAEAPPEPEPRRKRPPQRPHKKPKGE